MMIKVTLTPKLIILIGILLLTFLQISCDDVLPESGLTITSPEGGDHWKVGEVDDAQIEWVAEEIEGQVRLDLVLEDTIAVEITPGVDASSQTFTWTVPYGVQARAGYHVLISSLDDPEIFDTSPNLNIDPPDSLPQIEIIYPSNNETWEAGRENGSYVEWTAFYIHGLAKVELHQSDTLFYTLSDSIELDSCQAWFTLPDTTDLGGGYRVYIESLVDNTISASSANFRVVELDTSRHLDLLEPAGGSRWQVGQEDGAVVRWNGNEVGATIAIYLKQGDAILDTITASAQTSTGIFTWTVPMDIEPGNGFSVFIVANEDPTMNDESISFRIDEYEAPESFEFISPSNGDSWEAGVENGAEIEWESSGIDGAIKLLLYYDDEAVTTINDSITISEGEYTWTAPASLNGGQGYKVYAESLVDSSLNYLSNQFRINEAENPCAIEITSPSSGTRWEVLEENGAQIEWEYENIEGTINIFLYQDVSEALLIAEDVELTDSSYTWTVPIEVPSGTDYQVYVESTTDSLVNNLSRTFRIDPSPESPVLELEEPGPSTRWEIGIEDGAVIEWTSENLEGELKIDLYQDEQFIVSIVNSVPVADGSYSWTVPNTVPAGNGFQVYIESLVYPLVNDISSSFRINPQDIDAEIEVISPGQGDIWTLGQENALIEWSSVDLPGNIKIELYHHNSYYRDIATEIPVTDGQYSLNVPMDIEADSGYRIYLESLDYTEVNDLGANFTIEGENLEPVLEITSPLHNEEYETGSPLVIQWISENIDGTVHIDLYQQNSFIQSISTDISVADGEYTWNIPEDFTTGNNFKIYIGSDLNSEVNTFSDAFRIVEPNLEPSLEMILPENNSSYFVGETVPIQWTSENLEGTVHLDLYQQNTFIQTLESGVNILDGQSEWVIPEDYQAGNHYKIYIESDSNPDMNDESGSFSIDPLEQSFEVTAPEHGAEFSVGDQVQIQWISENIDGILFIDIYQQNNYVGGIATNVSVLDGQYTWTIPEDFNPGNNYKFYLECNNNPEMNDYSDTFSIEALEPSFEVITPEHGDEFSIGDNVQIQWISENIDGTLFIDIYQQNTYIGGIATGVSVLDGSYTWTIPEDFIAGNNYKFYLECDNYPDMNDESGAFSIQALEPSFEVTAPLQGEEYFVGDAVQIQWISENINGTLFIDLYQQNTFITSIATGVSVLDGAYTWTIPDDFAIGNNYKFYLECNDNPDMNDYSSTFTVSPVGDPEITVTSPGGGNNWTLGLDGVIEWDYANMTGNIKIDLYRQNNFIQQITASTDVSTGTYTWTVPATLESGNQYKVYVEWLDDSSINDFGQNFQIQEP